MQKKKEKRKKRLPNNSLRLPTKNHPPVLRRRLRLRGTRGGDRDQRKVGNQVPGAREQDHQGEIGNVLFGCFSSQFASFLLFSRCSLLFVQRDAKSNGECAQTDLWKGESSSRALIDGDSETRNQLPSRRHLSPPSLSFTPLVPHTTSTSSSFSFSSSSSSLLSLQTPFPLSTSAASSSTTRDCSTRTSSSFARSS